MEQWLTARSDERSRKPGSSTTTTGARGRAGLSTPRSTPNSIACNLEPQSISRNLELGSAACIPSHATPCHPSLSGARDELPTAPPVFARVASVERSIYHGRTFEGGTRAELRQASATATADLLAAVDVSDAAGMRSGYKVEKHISPVTWCEVGPAASPRRSVAPNTEIGLHRRGMTPNTSSPVR